MSNGPLDTVCRVATPEGCEIGLRLAGPATRARAWLLDFVLRGALFAALAVLLGFMGNFGSGLILVCGFLIEWFYPVLFEVYMRGQTPGKRAFGLVVLHDDGRPVGWRASFARNTLRFIDFLPFFYATGFIVTLLNRDGKRLGDLAAGTVVTYAEAVAGKSEAPPDSGETGVEAPPLPLSMEEQQALVEFSRRAVLLTEERAAELAEIPAPLTAGLTPDEARHRLLRIGNFLLGRR